MALDDERVSWVEMARRQREADDAQARADWEERELTESVEAHEVMWSEAFTAGALRPMVHYGTDDRPGIDRRCYHVNGDLG